MVSDKGFTVAVSGKGGVGKTNLAALLIRQLSQGGSVLAIDADPDSNLPQALGVVVRKSVGEVGESILNLPTRSPMALEKESLLERTLYEIVEETPGFDLVVMGYSDVGGCFCAISNIIRQVIDFKASSYDFTVIDCEAGLEHLSRRTTRDVDIMLAVTDATLNGLLTAKRVQELTKKLSLSFGEVMVVANKVTPEIRPRLDKLARENGVELAYYIPYDPNIILFDTSGRAMIELPGDSPASLAVAELCQHILSCTVS